MKSVVFPGPGRVDVVDVAAPELQKPTDALLRVTAAAICGSDLRSLALTTGDISWPVGHEFVGVVEAVGAGVTAIAVGDRCFVPMYLTCGHCAKCSVGEHQECPEVAVFGSSMAASRLPGGQAEYVRVPNADHTLFTLPDEVSDDQAVMMSDILATAMTVLEKLSLNIGDDILIVGCGPVGQLVTMCAPLFGVAHTYVADIDESRLQRAVELGGLPWSAAADDSRVKVDAAIDASGSPAALRLAFDALVPRGGRLGVLNMHGDLPFTSAELFGKRARVVTVLGNPYRWRSALARLISAGRIDPAKIVSHHLPIDDAVEAYDLFTSHGANKIVLVP